MLSFMSSMEACRSDHVDVSESCFFVKNCLCPLQVLLEAKNDFNSNDTTVWRARVGAYDVEKGDTLRLVMSNPLSINVSVMEESRQVPQLLQGCNSSDHLWVGYMHTKFLQHLCTYFQL